MILDPKNALIVLLMSFSFPLLTCSVASDETTPELNPANQTHSVSYLSTLPREVRLIIAKDVARYCFEEGLNYGENACVDKQYAQELKTAAALLRPFDSTWRTYYGIKTQQEERIFRELYETTVVLTNSSAPDTQFKLENVADPFHIKSFSPLNLVNSNEYIFTTSVGRFFRLDVTDGKVIVLINPTSYIVKEHADRFKISDCNFDENYTGIFLRSSDKTSLSGGGLCEGKACGCGIVREFNLHWNVSGLMIPLYLCRNIRYVTPPIRYNADYCYNRECGYYGKRYTNPNCCSCVISANMRDIADRFLNHKTITNEPEDLPDTEEDNTVYLPYLEEDNID